MGTVNRDNAASSGQVLSTTRTGTPPWTGGVYRTHGRMDLWTLGPMDLQSVERERQAIAVQPDADVATLLEAAEEDLVGQRIADFLLDDTRQWPGAVDRIEPFLCQPGTRLRLQREGHLALGQLRLELQDELLDNRLHRLLRQRSERDDGVEAVAKFGAEGSLDGGLRPALRLLPARVLLAGPGALGEADRRRAHLA